MSYIQLPFGVKEKNDKVKLNLAKNYKKQAFFSQLPYLANLDDPIYNKTLTIFAKLFVSNWPFKS